MLVQYDNFIYIFQAKATNPFAAAPEPAGGPESNTPNILDLFGVSAPPATAPVNSTVTSTAADPAAAAAGQKSSDDLLQLAGNPFASVLNSTSSTSTSQASTGLAFSSSPFAAPTGSNGTFKRLFSDLGY